MKRWRIVTRTGKGLVLPLLVFLVMLLTPAVLMANGESECSSSLVDVGTEVSAQQAPFVPDLPVVAACPRGFTPRQVEGVARCCITVPFIGDVCV